MNIDVKNTVMHLRIMKRLLYTLDDTKLNITRYFMRNCNND